MTFIEIPTEQTTAATDAILALVAAYTCFSTLKAGRANNPKKGRIWAWAFGLLAFAALTGAIAHGFQMSSRLNFILWQPLNLALGLTVSLFVVGVIYDLTKGALLKLTLPLLVTTGVLFYLITLLFPGSFLVFILYEAAAMVFSLVVYIALSSRHRLQGASVMATGILITIISAAIQASESVHFRCIWEFDHNGVFHLVQIMGIVVLYLGLRIDLMKIPFSLKQAFMEEVQVALLRPQEISLLTERDISHLPLPVQKYIRFTGAVGKEHVINFRLFFTGEMRLGKTGGWMKIRSEQYNFFDRISRFFYIRTRMSGLPINGLHAYRDANATMKIKLTGLFTVADAKGPEMCQGETVTVFNDMCFMAPATLIHPMIRWELMDDLTVRAWFTNESQTITATLHFNETGKLINFISDDRYASTTGKTYEKVRWSTPVSDYREINGRMVPTYGEAIWHYPEGDFCYGKFRVKEIRYNERR